MSSQQMNRLLLTCRGGCLEEAQARQAVMRPRRACCLPGCYLRGPCVSGLPLEQKQLPPRTALHHLTSERRVLLRARFEYEAHLSRLRSQAPHRTACTRQGMSRQPPAFTPVQRSRLPKRNESNYQQKPKHPVQWRSTRANPADQRGCRWCRCRHRLRRMRRARGRTRRGAVIQVTSRQSRPALLP
jgi:hypothetical protein